MENKDQESISAADLEVLKSKMEIISLKLDNQKVADNSEPKKSKPWWTTAVEMLALPALVVAILFQVSQTTSTQGLPEKTAAETAKLKTEELKARAELESMIDTLAEKKGHGISEYRDEIEKTIPRLEETIARLSQIENQSKEKSLESLFALYIILWIVYVGLSLVFEIISHVWATLLNSASNMAFSFRASDPDKPYSIKKRKRIEKLHRILPWMHSLLGPIPNLAEWAIRLSIFIAILIPLFDRTSLSMGSSYDFDSLLESAKSFDISSIIAQLKLLILK